MNFQELGGFTLYSRIDLKAMLTHLACDPVETKSPGSGVSVNPVLPDWTQSSRPLEKLIKSAATNVRVTGPRAGSSVTEQDNAIPQAGMNRFHTG